MVPERGGKRRRRDRDRDHEAWEWAEEGRVAGAEALGTALLVALGEAGAARGAGAAGAGLLVAALVQCLDHVSGAMFNPAVTLAAWLWGRVRARRALAALAAQLAGAALGAAALPALAPGATGVLRPAGGPRCSPATALALEAAGGAVLALVNCAAWDARTAHRADSWPLRIGATVAALSAVAGECSGASFNPARSFGPALVANDWRHHWVYWAGPLGGALAAAALYCAAWRVLPPPAPAAAAASPAPADH